MTNDQTQPQVTAVIDENTVEHDLKELAPTEDLETLAQIKEEDIYKDAGVEVASAENIEDIKPRKHLTDMSAAEFAQKSVNAAYDVLSRMLLEKLGDTEENRKWISQVTTPLRHNALSMSFHGLNFCDMFNHYVIGQREIERPALFAMEDMMRGFRNNATCLPITALASRLDVFGDDQRWSYDPLPVARLFGANIGEERVPVKGQTLDGSTVFGYLELFIQEKAVGEQVVRLTTEIPAIRIKNNYIAPNAIYRWFEVTERDVKDAWLQGRDIVAAPPLKEDDAVTETSEAPL